MTAPASNRSLPPLLAVHVIALVAGCAIAVIAFGPRSSLGLFLLPMTQEFGFGRDTFGLAIAIQNLLWGATTPVAGALADRFGPARVLSGGALLYAIALALMTTASTPGLLHLSAGFLFGFALGGCSFNIVIAAFGKLLPPEWRPLAFGAGSAAGSFGQFLFPPIAAGLIPAIGWQESFLVLSATTLLILPLSLALATRNGGGGSYAESGPEQSIRQALGEALRYPSYVLLVTGFFTCGFQLAFITAHLPAYLVDVGLSATVGGWTLAAIGLFNIIGSLLAGALSTRMPMRMLLAAIYLGRSLAIAAFILLPASPANAVVFGMVIGFLWLSTVPPTSALVLLMFGNRYLAMLFGVAFFSHQVGGFLGVWLGGVMFEATGSYDLVWWASIALGVASAAINLPIKERPVMRPAAVAA